MNEKNALKSPQAASNLEQETLAITSDILCQGTKRQQEPGFWLHSPLQLSHIQKARLPFNITRYSN